MSDANVTALIRIAGALTIAGCLWLAVTVLRPYPDASITLVGTATFLYGVLGFKPLDPVLALILQKLGPSKVATLSTRPPALPMPMPVPGDSDYNARASAPSALIPARSKAIPLEPWPAAKGDDEEPK